MCKGCVCKGVSEGRMVRARGWETGMGKGGVCKGLSVQGGECEHRKVCAWEWARGVCKEVSVQGVSVRVSTGWCVHGGCAMQCNPMQCNATQSHAMQCNPIQRNAVQSHIV